jgi:D-alanyl-D-alanine dipeptidase/L,D-peptidoglycan transpeptidase YkuD (ErfK/YbiS/YcfS/YnhG family)
MFAKSISGILFFFICGFMGTYADEHQQLLVVTTENWEATQGKLVLYERFADTWIPVRQPIPVVIGKTGLAWGLGLHPTITGAPWKKEGDRKSPAGIFSLGTAFGFAPKSELSLKLGYLPLDDAIEAVDDPNSCHYNLLVDRRKVVCDWKSAEKMGEEPLYELGFVVNHNFPNPKPGAGSAIFFHIWHGENSTTTGCTAMSLENLHIVLSWLDKEKRPALVQLPLHKYVELQSEWNLPPLSLPELVNIAEVIPEIVLDIRYATSDNFMGFPVYTKPLCYLHKMAAKALRSVQTELAAKGLRLKVFDGYRPLSVQQAMWDVIQDERYVANPAVNKGVHTRGISVDLTLIDQEGRELLMPTSFDDFTERAHSDCADLPEEAIRNRTTLTEVMLKHGFEQAPAEWWHFNLKGWQDDALFPPLNIPL